MAVYRHKVQYYETDQMGIAHHSNYIRWMEEARVALLDELGMPFKAVEEAGLCSPVLSVQGNYLKMTHFEDEIDIDVFVTEYGGMRFTFEYEMRNAADGSLCFTGSSRHCFLTREGKPTLLKRARPEWDEKLRSLIKQNGEED